MTGRAVAAGLLLCSCAIQQMHAGKKREREPAARTIENLARVDRMQARGAMLVSLGSLLAEQRELEREILFCARDLQDAFPASVLYVNERERRAVFERYRQLEMNKASFFCSLADEVSGVGRMQKMLARYKRNRYPTAEVSLQRPVVEKVLALAQLEQELSRLHALETQRCLERVANNLRECAAAAEERCELWYQDYASGKQGHKRRRFH